MVEPAFGSGGPRYVRWAAEMAVGLQTGVPWMMCKQNDAPDPIVSFHYYIVSPDCTSLANNSYQFDSKFMTRLIPATGSSVEKHL